MRSKWSIVVKIWEFTQVELHGSYSTGCVVNLSKYATETCWCRVFGVLISTPVPCLIVTVFADVFPLADPDGGLKPTRMFFLREYYTFIVLTFFSMHQFRTGVPILPYPMGRFIRDTIIVAAITVVIIYALIQVIGFPLPFVMLAVSPVWLSLIMVCLAIQWSKKMQQIPGSKRMAFDMLMMSMCDAFLASVYSVYFYVFKELTSTGQMAFALLLPVIKLCMRNVFAKVATTLNDERPEIVVFNAELFNALFVAYCLQSAPSIWTSLVMMLADGLTAVLALYDLDIARQGLVGLEREIDQENNWRISHDTIKTASAQGHTSATLERASTILQQTMNSRSGQLGDQKLSSLHVEQSVDVSAEISNGKKLMVTSYTTVPKKMTAHGPKQQLSKGISLTSVKPAPESPETPATRRYVSKVRRLLYMAEFLILLNYVEVVIPLVFSIYLVITFQLPNREFYSVFDDMDQLQLLSTLKSVLFYCSLQFVSLLLLTVVLQRMLGISPIRLLAFVLEKQFNWVQISLVTWLFYTVQASLQHSGYDYTFKFEWLYHQTDPTSTEIGST